MDTTTIDARDDEDWDSYENAPAEPALPVRSRRKFLNGTTALLIAAITAAAGFYAGVRVEKSQTTSAGAGGLAGSGAGGSALASRLRSLLGGRAGGGAAGGGAAGGGAAGGGAAGGGAAGGGAAGAGAAGAGAAGAGGFAGGGFAARLGGGNAGTVSSVSGNTITLSEASGNTVKVTLGSQTKVSKSQPASHHAVRPGDTIVVQGATKSNGTIVATSVTDSGNNATSAPSSGSGAGGGGGLGSLFSSGG